MRVAIDRGGTFTDCLAVAADGCTWSLKVPSGPDSVVRGVSALTHRHPMRIDDVRLGTTLATNTLLERTGAEVALITTAGFEDLLWIRDQRRPELFALCPRRRPPLTARVFGLPRGDAWEDQELRDVLRRWAGEGVRSLAVALMGATLAPSAERRVARIARQEGVEHVSLSHELSAGLGLLARVETAVLDAYLTPDLRKHLGRLEAALAPVPIRVMTSAGGLAAPSALRGVAALLSGPAGGVVGAARVAEPTGVGAVVGLDMGGTSTDVCRIGGEPALRRESEIDGVWVRSAMVDVHTIAAGGGSICGFDGDRLFVGPRSAGARPGPLCYGHAEAREPTLTDAALVLGRVRPERFPLPLEAGRARAALAELAKRCGSSGAEEVAQRLFDVAVESMALALRRVSVGRGHDLCDHALVPFGAAAGQYACAVARRAGIRRLVHHPMAGVLSAYGILQAAETWRSETALGGDRPLGDAFEVRLDAAMAELEDRARSSSDVGPGWDRSFRIALGYRGAELTLELDPEPRATLEARFHAEHRQRYGYCAEARRVEARTLHLVCRSEAAPLPVLAPGAAMDSTRGELWLDGGFMEVPLVDRSSLAPGEALRGPAVIVEGTSTFVLEPDFSAQRTVEGALLIVDDAPAGRRRDEPTDAATLEVFEQRFAAVAEEMGEVFRRTAASTNIRERLDFSCAVFDAQGALVANAPHIPVHLGSMGRCVRALLAAHPDWREGQVYASNDPSMGGTHLPDITVVSPLFFGGERPQAFVASRGHHADIGGVSPGSMPVDSRTLSDEGVVLRDFLLVEDGRLRLEALHQTLSAGPHPARDPGQNVADLEAALAANAHGLGLLRALVEEEGLGRVQTMMGAALDHGERAVRAWLRDLEDGERVFEDELDSGAKVVVRLEVRGDSLEVDFSGTAAESDDNSNAPEAVTTAALLYVLRVLAAKDLPMNDGCLRPVVVHIPPGSLLSPSPGRPVAAGNVETSQRVVDVLLGALGAAAASQGTMNNLSFGDGDFGYYETLGGGAGACPEADGGSALQTHMTNSRITDPELLEARFPIRVRRYALRPGSGGEGARRGGDGLVRELEFLRPLSLSLITERRTRAPYGLAGGKPGAPGRNLLNGRELGGRAQVEVEAGDVLTVETPGGGGYGEVR